MTREELKRLWFSIPTDPNKKQENTLHLKLIKVKMHYNMHSTE